MAVEADETTPLGRGRAANSPRTTYQSITKVPAKQAGSHVVADEENVPKLSPAKPAVEVLTSVRSVITVLLLGEFISNADSTLVMTAIARITSEFNQLQGAAWLSVGYTLGLCAAQPMYGRLSDIYGRKPLLLGSYFFLALGCVVCGLATDLWIVILGRALSGIGGAGVMTMSSIIITGRLLDMTVTLNLTQADIVSKREVAKWRAYVNVSMTLGRSIGGPVGGVLTDTIGWRWAFLLQAPLLGLAALLVTLQLKLARQAPTDAGTNGAKIGRIDFRGGALLAISITTIILLLDQGGKLFSWKSLATVALASSGVLTIALFVYTELYVAAEPIFDLRILRRPNVASGYLTNAFQIAAQVGMMFTVPLYFQVTARASNTAAGAHLIPAVLGNTVGGLSAGMFIRRTGNYKPILVVAGLVACITYLLQYVRWNGETGPWESLYIVFGGIGSGSCSSASFVSMTAFLEPHEIAMATAGFLLLLNLALTAGVTTNYTVLGAEFKRQLQHRLHGPDAHKIIKHALSSIAYIVGLTGTVRETVVSCYVAGLKHVYLVSLICSALASVAALTAKNHRL
ncbi:major facilitator superfamily domain-containing protein [Aspergillus lucknowensis]|uniref:Major facilitator superfamily domain-containing protein n=1 Tax=Aspergillus lucknowensis TaxID=176173 RepID=A0ABR4LTG1_9EURO